MLKNLLTKKLYQFCLVLLLFSFSLTSEYNLVLAQFGSYKYTYTQGGTTFETNCWGPRDFGTTSEETKTANCVKDTGSTNCKILYSSSATTNHAFAFDLINGDPLCYKGTFQNSAGRTITFYTSYGNNKRSRNGGFEVYINKPLSESFNVVASTLKECQDNVSKKRIQNPLLNKFYSDVRSCWLDEYSNSNKLEDLSTLNGCKYVRSGFAYDAGRLPPKDEAKCSCWYGGYFLRNTDPLTWESAWSVFGNTWDVIKGEFTNVSIHYGTKGWFGTGGSISSYKAGSTIEENIRACEAANPNRYFNPLTGQCYSSAALCNVANSGFCTTEDENKFFVKTSATAWQEKTLIQIQNLLTSCSGARVPGAPINPSCTYVSSASRCECSTFYNPQYEVLYCTANPSDNTRCSKLCKYVAVNLTTIQPVTINSPLALIKVVVNFLFWLAVVIFIINMLSAALDYIKGGDQPDKLKEASDRITGTIFGFVFLLVASGVINYIIERVNEFIP